MHRFTQCKHKYVSHTGLCSKCSLELQKFALSLPHVLCPQPASYSEAQKIEMKDSLLYKDLVEPAHWVGLRKCDDLLEYLRVSGKKTPLTSTEMVPLE